MYGKLTTEALAAELWDLYKDAYGVRPHHVEPAQWADHGFLERLWHQCCAVLDARL
jgi:hypothetical protein